MKFNLTNFLRDLPQVAYAGIEASNEVKDKLDEDFLNKYLQMTQIYVNADPVSEEYKTAAKWLADATGLGEDYFLNPPAPPLPGGANKKAVDDYASRMSKVATATTTGGKDWRDFRRKILLEGLLPLQKEIYEKKFSVDISLDPKKAEREWEYALAKDPRDIEHRDYLAQEAMRRKQEEFEKVTWPQKQREIDYEHKLKLEQIKASKDDTPSAPDLQKIYNEIDVANEKTKNLAPEDRKKQLEQHKKIIDTAYGAKGVSYTEILEVPYFDKDSAQWRITYEIHPATFGTKRPSYKMGSVDEWYKYLQNGATDIEAELWMLNNVNPKVAQELGKKINKEVKKTQNKDEANNETDKKAQPQRQSPQQSPKLKNPKTRSNGYNQSIEFLNMSEVSDDVKNKVAPLINNLLGLLPPQLRGQNIPTDIPPDQLPYPYRAMDL